jgi:V/A-type H+-transporting ATPase subunit G/H
MQGGDRVSIDILQSIVQTEEEADQIVRQSVTDARQIVIDAENQSYTLVEQSVQDAEESSGKIILEAEKIAQDKIDSFKQQVEQECSEIRQQAGERMSRAVDLIIGRIIKVHGNN